MKTPARGSIRMLKDEVIRMIKTLEIRPSTIQSMSLCPARTMLRGKPRYNTVPNEALPFGSLVHWLIEQHLDGERSTIESTTTRLKEIFEDDSGYELSHYATGRRIGEVVREAMAAFDAWTQQVERYLPKGKPIIEQQMRHTIGAGIVDGVAVPVELFGTPDAIYREAKLILDWKTAGKRWDTKKVEAQLQPIAYPWLVEQEMGLVAEEFAFVVFARDSSMWHFHNIKLTKNKRRLQAFKDLAVGYALMTERGVPIYTPGGQAFHATRGWHCSPKYCDAWGACDGKYLIADGKEQQPALRDTERGWS